MTHWGGRVGVGVSLAVHLLIVGAMLFRWQAVEPMMTPDLPTFLVSVAPPVSPPSPVRDVAPGPRQIERQRASRQTEAPRHRPPSQQDLSPFAEPQPAPSPPSPGADSRLPVARTTAPPAAPAPPAPRLSSAARDSWEGRLLAHLEKYRRYPANARAARLQGTVHVRFRLNRTGGVLEAAVLRSSGSDMLDRAALATLRRAQPLPAIPEALPDEIELSVPVEFFMD